MFVYAAVAFLVIVLVVIKPKLEEQQDKKLAERLKNTKSPTEAGLLLDATMQSRRDGSGFLGGAMRFLRIFFHI